MVNGDSTRSPVLPAAEAPAGSAPATRPIGGKAPLVDGESAVIEHTGGCLCGRLRFAAEGKPRYTFHCHCFMCRRQTGAAVATFAGFRVAGVFRWTKGRPATYASSPGVRRKFCTRCGTPLTFEADRYPDEIHIAISAFDDPDALPPGFHVHTGAKIAWFDTADHLPRYTESSDGTEPMPPT